MNFLQQALSYLLTASNWTGPVGLAVRTCEHLEYTAVAVAASALIAVPVGLLIGHTGRGRCWWWVRSMVCALCPRWVFCC